VPHIACFAVIMQCFQHVVPAFNTALLIVLQVEHCGDVCEAAIVSTTTIDCVKLIFKLSTVRWQQRDSGDLLLILQHQSRSITPRARAFMQPVYNLQHIGA